MGAIAERYIPGMAAPADGYGRSSSKAKFLAFLIHNFKISFDANRTIAKNCHFCSCHEFLRKMKNRLRRALRLQDNGGSRRIQEPPSTRQSLF
jgi:hypothetical protein